MAASLTIEAIPPFLYPFLYMDAEIIFKLAAIGIVVAVLNQLLVRAGREEQALLTTIAGLVCVLFLLTREIGALFETIKTIFHLS